jgi:formamidopyrimidine-DNA glycosylase
MPELPEVETVARQLRPALIGRVIERVELLDRRAARGSPRPLSDCAGRRITALRRRAKFILVELSGDGLLVFHLGMTGWLGVRAESAPAVAPPHLRACFFLGRAAADAAEEQQRLLFRDARLFGRILCGPRDRLLAHPSLAELGPEALELPAGDFVERLAARRGRLKSLLLNQRFLAGLGNIYADESLHAARLHPCESAGDVPPAAARRLHAAIQRILRRALRAGGTTVRDFLSPAGQAGWFVRELRVYGREGWPCRNCGARIRRMVIAQRGAWFCPRCQKPDKRR